MDVVKLIEFQVWLLVEPLESLGLPRLCLEEPRSGGNSLNHHIRAYDV
jgi:hypothetical protein